MQFTYGFDCSKCCPVGYPKAINFEEDIISRYYWTFDAIALAPGCFQPKQLFDLGYELFTAYRNIR